MADIKEPEVRSVSIAHFVDVVSSRLSVRAVSSAEVLSRHRLNSSRVQKLGLALSGFADKIHRGRVQIYGNSEQSFLARLSREETKSAFERLDKSNISCILVTADMEPPPELLYFADSHQVPLLLTSAPSSEAITAIAAVLAEYLAPETTIHGTLMQVFGIGVLILGESGIGKSECALDLITRGHRLISDDSVKIRRVGDKLTGSAPESIRDFLEIRGLGIINARDLFGVSALAPSTEIHFSLEFSESTAPSTDRLGLELSLFSVLGMDIQKYPLPVRPGRNLGTLVEAAVRVFVSRQDGPNAVEKLIFGHNEALAAHRRN